VSIEGLTISGSHDGDDADMTANSAIFVTGNHATIHRCKFTNLRGYAVQVDGADDAEISYCYASNVATAASPVKYTRYTFLIINASQRAKVHHNYITGWSQGVGFWYGIDDSEAAHNILINNLGHETGPARRSAFEDFGDTVQNTGNRWLNNYVSGSTSHCMELAQGLKGTLVQGNTFAGAGTGYASAGFPVSLTGGDGGAGGETSDGVQIIGNRIYGRADGAIVDHCSTSGGVDGVTWQDNEFFDFQEATATLYIQTSGSTTQNVVIRGNRFRDCGGDGGQPVIRLQVDGCVVEGNDILSAISNTRGIYCETSDGHTITGNTISVLGNLAIQARHNNTITHNNLTSSTPGVITFTNGNEVHHNTVLSTNTADNGDAMSIGGNENQVSKNRVTRDGGTGACIICNTTDNRIVSNWVVHTGDGTTIGLNSNSRRTAVYDNTCVRPDGATGRYDNDATVSNVSQFNHTLTTLGTW
jgi:hypothetical protein